MTVFLEQDVDQAQKDWGFALKPVDFQGWPAQVSWSTDPDPLRGEARLLVHRLQLELPIKSELIATLQNAAGLSESVRERALEIAQKSSAHDASRLLGKWTVLSVADGGKKPDELPDYKIVFMADTIIYTAGGKTLSETTYKLDPGKQPGWIDLVSEGNTMRGIYQFEQETLRICINETPGANDLVDLNQRQAQKTNS